MICRLLGVNRLQKKEEVLCSTVYTYCVFFTDFSVICEHLLDIRAVRSTRNNREQM